MNEPNTSDPPPAGTNWIWFVRVALLAALIAYGILLARNTGGYAGGSDSSGYLNHAKLLHEGRLHVPQREIEGLAASALPEFAYIPLGFRPVNGEEMVPTYPIGLSLLIAAAAPVTGWDAAPVMTLWIHALLGVVLMYAMTRAAGFSAAGSALGALLLAGSPLYLFCSVQAMSDTPSLAWTLAAVYFAWRGRKHDAWAIAAGVAVAVAVLVRPTNLLVLVPVALALGWSARRALFLALGGLPGAVYLAIINHKLYGAIFTTGYGNVSGTLSWANVPLVLKNGAQWLPVLLTPALALLLVLPWVRNRAPRPALTPGLLVAWTAVFAGFYMFYFHTSESWWYLRFLLPAFPPVILGLLWAGRALLAGRSVRTLRVATALALVAVAGWQGWWAARLSALKIGDDERVFLLLARWAQAHIPPKAVIACTQAGGTLLYYTDFTFLRFESVPDAATLLHIEQACADTNRPIYAALFPYEVKGALEQFLPGKWTQVGATRGVTFWRRDGSTPAPVEPQTWRELTTTHWDGGEAMAQVSPEWYDLEHSLRHQWIWNRGQGDLEVQTWPAGDGVLELRFSLRSLKANTVRVRQEGTVLWQGTVDRAPTRVTIRTLIRNGLSHVQFFSDRPGTAENASPGARQLAFAMYDLEIRRPGTD